MGKPGHLPRVQKIVWLSPSSQREYLIGLVPIWWVAFLCLVLVEETSLERALGQRYLDYKQRVKGRIIPGLPI